MAVSTTEVFSQQNTPGLVTEVFYVAFTELSTTATLTPTVMNQILSVTAFSNTAGQAITGNAFVPGASTTVDIVASGPLEGVVTLTGRIA